MNVGHTLTTRSIQGCFHWLVRTRKYRSGWFHWGLHWYWWLLWLSVSGPAHLETACAPIVRVHSTQLQLSFSCRHLDVFFILTLTCVCWTNRYSLWELKEEWKSSDFSSCFIFHFQHVMNGNVIWANLEKQYWNMKEGVIVFIITWMQLCVKMIISADLIYIECSLLLISLIFDNDLYKVSWPL